MSQHISADAKKWKSIYLNLYMGHLIGERVLPSLKVKNFQNHLCMYILYFTIALLYIYTVPSLKSTTIYLYPILQVSNQGWSQLDLDWSQLDFSCACSQKQVDCGQSVPGVLMPRLTLAHYHLCHIPYINPPPHKISINSRDREINSTS